MAAGWRLVGATPVIRGVGPGLGTESPRANDLIKHTHVMGPPETPSTTGFGENLVVECTPVPGGGLYPTRHGTEIPVPGPFRPLHPAVHVYSL